MPLSLRPLARVVAKTVQRLRGNYVVDVRAVALTDSGEVVLVRHRYVSGWYLPGGGRRIGADPEAAALRELREEIGMIDHATVNPLGRARAVDGGASLFLVRGVRYRVPRWSWEIEAVAAFALDALPADATPKTRAQIALAVERLHRMADPAAATG